MKTTSADPALLVGLDAPDDAAVYRVSDDVAVVQTVDFFTPIVDDPFAWGRISAANAMSDIYAMGARPITALSLVAWPRALDFGLLGRVIDGAGAACDEAGVAIVGGHSIDDPEPKFGLAVTGTIAPDRLVRKSGARPGASLILTKPLGMGIISSGIKESKTSEATASEAIAIMSELNAAACEAMLEIGVQAATDVTGYGLLGHLLQMLDDDCSAEVRFSSVPVLREAFDLAAAGVLPGGSKRNREATRPYVDEGNLSDTEMAVLYDAQTSGGLLLAVDADRCDHLLRALRGRGVERAAVVGEIVDGQGRIAMR